MNNTTTFTARELSKLGFSNVKELNFHDDGTNFKVYQKGNVFISYTKVDGDFYLSIRPDYIKGFDYDSYKLLDTYESLNNFNGVSFIDADELKDVVDAYQAELKTYGF